MYFVQIVFLFNIFSFYYVPDKGIYMNHSHGLFGPVCSNFKKTMKISLMLCIIFLFFSFLNVSFLSLLLDGGDDVALV